MVTQCQLLVWKLWYAIVIYVIISLPADVLWGWFVTRNECVTNEPQRMSAGRLCDNVIGC